MLMDTKSSTSKSYDQRACKHLTYQCSFTQVFTLVILIHHTLIEDVTTTVLTATWVNCNYLALLYNPIFPSRLRLLSHSLFCKASFGFGHWFFRLILLCSNLTWSNLILQFDSPECEATHCVIHRKILASQKISPELHTALNNVVKMINIIKAHALNNVNIRLFEKICEDMDVNHKCLLLHIEVRWLNRGRSLKRVFKLSELLQRFLLEKNPDLASKFNDEKWILKLAYCTCVSYFNIRTN